MQEDTGVPCFIKLSKISLERLYAAKFAAAFFPSLVFAVLILRTDFCLRGLGLTQ